MDTQVIIFDEPVHKKHSVRFDTSDKDAIISSVYVKRGCFGVVAPTKLKVTIEDVSR